MLATLTQLDLLSDRMRALGDATRLHILTMLVAGESCQCEIKDELGISQPLLAFHLKALRDSGLVRGSRRGKWVFYSLCNDAIADIRAFLNQLNATDAQSTCCTESPSAESSSSH